jgi:hypothetical protein
MYKYIFKRINEVKGRRRGTSAGHLRDGCPVQKRVQDNNVELEQFLLSFDYKLADWREQLREELDMIKTKASRYNSLVSTDNKM